MTEGEAPPPSRSYAVRFYRPGDETGIIELVRAVFPVHRSRDVEYWRWLNRDSPGGNSFVEIAESEEKIIGTVWKWQQTLYSNDTQAQPANSADYTLTLLQDGQLSIRADCNVGGGVYTLSGQRISLEIRRMTRAACPPGSLDSPYIRDLHAAALYFTKDQSLYLDLKYDTGTMRFSK